MTFDDAFCPVCGYYCLGKGGMGCIDKPSLIKMEGEQMQRKLELIERVNTPKMKVDQDGSTVHLVWAEFSTQRYGAMPGKFVAEVRNSGIAEEIADVWNKHVDTTRNGGSQ